MQVNVSLIAAHKRLQIAKEEKDQFEEANNQILEHLKTKVLTPPSLGCQALREREEY